MSSVEVEVNKLHSVVFLIVVNEFRVDSVNNFWVHLTFFYKEKNLKKYKLHK
jgi:hypothetical protein